MIALFAEALPLWQVVGALLLDVGLCVGAVGAGEFLGDGILDADAFDCFVKATEGIMPVNVVVSIPSGGGVLLWLWVVGMAWGEAWVRN